MNKPTADLFFTCTLCKTVMLEWKKRRVLHLADNNRLYEYELCRTCEDWIKRQRKIA